MFKKIFNNKLFFFVFKKTKNTKFNYKNKIFLILHDFTQYSRSRTFSMYVSKAITSNRLGT